MTYKESLIYHESYDKLHLCKLQIIKPHVDNMNDSGTGGTF